MGSRGASQIRAAPFAQVADGLIGEGAKMAGGDIRLELLVPRGGVEAEKPIAERGQIVARELLDGVLNVKNGAHVGRISLVDFRASAETHDPKLSDRGAWRGSCEGGAAERGNGRRTKPRADETGPSQNSSYRDTRSSSLQR